MQHPSVKQALKQKELQLQSQQQTILAQEKQIATLRQKLDDSDGHKKYAEYQAKIKEADARSQDLARQLRHMERI